MGSDGNGFGFALVGGRWAQSFSLIVVSDDFSHESDAGEGGGVAALPITWGARHPSCARLPSDSAEGLAGAPTPVLGVLASSWEI